MPPRNIRARGRRKARARPGQLQISIFEGAITHDTPQQPTSCRNGKPECAWIRSADWKPQNAKNSAISKLGLQVHNDISPLITEAWESCYHTTAPTHLRFFVFLCYVARTKTGLSPGSGEMSPLPPLTRKGENMQPQCAHVPSAAALLANVRLGKTAYGQISLKPGLCRRPQVRMGAGGAWQAHTGRANLYLSLIHI